MRPLLRSRADGHRRRNILVGRVPRFCFVALVNILAVVFLWKQHLQVDNILNLALAVADLTPPEPEQYTAIPSQSTLAAPVSHHRMLYVGEFGLGHRMSKLSAAFHLAKQVGIEQLEVYFGHCKAPAKTKQWDIFHHLFGMTMVSIPGVLNETHQFQLFQGNTKTNKVILIRNDVAQYYAGQAYKNARIPIPTHGVSDWHDKMDTDATFFRYLIGRFIDRYATQYQPFINALDNYHVIGLHIRAGNGESYHFAEAQRAVNETSLFCQHVIDLVAQTLPQAASRTSIIFLATDTPSVISLVKKAARRHKLQVVTFSQTRLANDQGVSYASWTEGEQCLDGWKSSMMDMVVLATRADVVIAAMRSTFTQIVPLSLQFSKQTSTEIHRFCEVADSGRDMTCFTSRNAWLFRQDQLNMNTFSLDNDTEAVVHKVMVHLPELRNATPVQDELHDGVPSIRRFLSDASDEKVYVYGDHINQKYRSKRFTFRQDWTWMP